MEKTTYRLMKKTILSPIPWSWSVKEPYTSYQIPKIGTELPQRKNCLSIWKIPALIIIACLLLSSCSDSNETVQHEMSGASVPLKVTYRLKWLFNAGTAGDIWADRAGFFKKAGLDVTVEEGGAEQDAITDIEMGRALFGTASADQVIRAVEKGAHVIVVAQIFQENPLQWIYSPELTPAIRTPQDLKGLTVGITYGGNDETIFTALMKKYHLTEDDLNLYGVHYDYAPFWRGEVNLWPVYRNTEGIVLMRKMAANGQKTAFFDPGRYGIKFVANSIITSTDAYHNRPEVVKKFTRALIAAWEDALTEKNRRQVAETVHIMDSDTPIPVIMDQLESTQRFVYPSDSTPIGTINRPAWRQTAAIMLDQGIIKKKIDLSNILDPRHYLSGYGPAHHR